MYVEGEGLWLADYHGGEVGMGRIQEVAAFALYDDARNLEHNASLAPDQLVAYALELGRSRVGAPSIGQHGMVQALYEGIFEAGRDERVGGEEARLLQVDQDLEISSPEAYKASRCARDPRWIHSFPFLGV